MASLVTPRLRFLHVPKTGGIWATEAMGLAGVPIEHPESLSFHAGLAESCSYADRFTFAFVRHPLDFWRSYWGYRVRTGWNQEHSIDRLAGSDRFEEFVEGIIARFPGEAGLIFERYVGSTVGQIDFVGRHERLASDLCTALRLAGEDFDERILRCHPRANATDYGPEEALYSRFAAERLARAEQVAIERFYPGDPVPSRLILRGSRARFLASLDRRLATVSSELRVVKTELELARVRERELRALLNNSQLEREQVLRDLDLVRGSRLQRWTRPLRACWYRYRPSAAAKGVASMPMRARGSVLERTRAVRPQGRRGGALVRGYTRRHE